MGLLNWLRGGSKQFVYSGGEVSRPILEDALEFLISIEPDPDSPTAMEDYAENMRKHEKAVSMANEALRQYAEQIEPQTLSAMQNAYYSITNSSKFTSSAIRVSVVTSVLNSAWNGVGPWES